MAGGEFASLAPGTSTRNRDAHLTVGIDAHQVASRTPVPHEQEPDRLMSRDLLNIVILLKRQPELHPEKDT
jgi:hypothetical protein